MRPEQLRRILLDAQYVRAHGRWLDATERFYADYAEHKEKKLNRTVGCGLEADRTADDVAKLLGLDRKATQATARDVLFESPADILARVLAELRAEIKQAELARKRRTWQTA